jgi:hypothetical protein
MFSNIQRGGYVLKKITYKAYAKVKRTVIKYNTPAEGSDCLLVP